MSDLESLAAFAAVKAIDLVMDPAERRLWEQIAAEIGEYLAEPADTGLFEVTP